jgi:hypothetical protein
LACHLTIAALLLFISGCSSIRLNRQLNTLSEFGRLDKKSPFLKVHMLDGRVYVLSQWQELDKERQIKGKGALLDLNRNQVEQGDFAIPLEGVALFETNVIKTSDAEIGLTVVTGLSLALTAYCLLNPKACFGSCPTFYTWDGDSMALQAEGFSASVAPALEAKDVDALFLARPSSSLLEVRVTNEALETHLIRFAHLLAAPRPESGRVFIGPGGEFWQASELREPVSCSGPEGDIREKIRFYDGLERSSEADPKDLAKREMLELVFEAPADKPCGLVLGFRQTLLTTYLFYQGLAYLGDTTGYWLAQLGRGDGKARRRMEAPGLCLGGIEVYQQDKDKNWHSAGSLQETGPIATNIQIIPLPEPTSSPLKVRLRLTKGLWRLDYIALAALEGKTEPVVIPPATVVRQRISEFCSGDGGAGTGAKWPLVTLPGDIYSLTYELPDDFDRYELFIETQGYYLEWLRESWMKEKNLARARLMFTNPAKFLKKMAPEYKKIEPQMEDVFWRSRYAKPTTH